MDHRQVGAVSARLVDRPVQRRRCSSRAVDAHHDAMQCSSIASSHDKTGHGLRRAAVRGRTRTTSAGQRVTTWNQDPKPFVWHKTADQILERLAGYCTATPNKLDNETS